MEKVTLKVEKHYNENKAHYDEIILQGAESFLQYYKDHYVDQYDELMSISHIRTEIGNLVAAFPEPNCYFVASSLNAVFPGHIIYNSNHCIFVSASGDFYDKRGSVDPIEIATGHYLPLSDFGWDPQKRLIDSMLERHGK